MNQDQRKFLIEQIRKTYDRQKEKLRKKRPEPPSLNNYLVAAFLDNTIKFKDIEKLRREMRERVLSMGKDDVLIKDSDSRWRNRRDEDEDVDNHSVVVSAEDLFVLPEAYINELEKYKAAREIYEREMDHLEEYRDTIIMKIQIGSNAVLDKLITQVDNMGDLNLINSRLKLAGPEK